MSDESEIGVVLANAPRIRKAFGANRATLITLLSLLLARRRPGFIALALSVLARAVTLSLLLCLIYLSAQG
jgi:hypothetical protein